MDSEKTTSAIFSDSNIDLKPLLDDRYVVVCDTNVFLGLYRHSPDYANFALECLKKVSANVVLPYTVKIEFEKNYRKQYKLRQQAINNAADDSIKIIENQSEKLQNSIQTLVNRHFPEAEKLKEHVESKYDEIREMLVDYFNDRSVLSLIHDSWTSDVVNEFFRQLLLNGQVMVDFTRDEIYSICEEGEERYKKENAPGHKDSKTKDGIRKYSDFILWKEILNYAKSSKVNILFVTDDIKQDWWNITKDSYEFLPHLIHEFNRDVNKNSTVDSYKIIPFVSSDFFDAISKSMDVHKSDVVDQALLMTDDDYIDNVNEKAFDSILHRIVYSGLEYVDTSTMSYTGSQGIDEWVIESYELDTYHVNERIGNQVFYNLIYSVKLVGESYDYWGRDDDTKGIITSPAYHHEMEGCVVVSLTRSVSMFTDFSADFEYDNAELAEANFTETAYSSWEEDDDDVPDAYDTCPDCGRPINFENDALNGFCTDCADRH